MLNTQERLLHFRRRLEKLDPIHLEIRDDSDKHVGHVGAASGAGHYSLSIVSRAFEGLNALARHRLIYAHLEDFMENEIHALSISALTPAEAARKNESV